ncbi:hypothetical protein MLD38_003442 [Melastoma candidum]|uniref:Uncharacterized protein n=1 Tax=Melastoma candidum TaxID=119954 RepID=A0ACB9S6G7_9MYRT|nr:hypothetical protein MLD38_003442 [Melastoma candidum]
MARNHAVLIFTAAAAVLLLSVGASAPASAPAPTMMAPAPAPTLDCSSYFTNLTDCLPYVVQGSNLTKPDKGCCPELAGLLDSNPICLCSLLGVASSFGVDVNRAIKLPSACNITTPSLSLCPGFPVGVPTASEGPAGAPSTVPAAATPPSGLTTPSIAQVPSPGNSGKRRNGAPPAVIMGLVLGLVGLFF